MSTPLPSSLLVLIATAYVLVSAAACLWAFRRGRLGLLLPTLLAAIVSGLLLAGSYALLGLRLFEPKLLMAGRELLGESLRGAVGDGLALKLGSKVLVIERPLWLMLASLVPWLVPGLLISLTDMSRRQLWLQLLVRSVLLGCLSLALSQPAILGERQKLSVVALVDVSDSVSASQLAMVTSQLESLRAETNRRGDDLHIVRFAGRPRLVPLPASGVALPPLRTPHSKDVGDDDTDRTASNLQAALQLSYGLHAPGTLRRTVLFSDGNQTEGDVLGESVAAARRNVAVSVVPLLASDSPEVLVRELRMSGGPSADAQLKVGAPFTLEAEVYSNVTQSVRLELSQNGVPNPEDDHRDLELTPGRNLIRFRSEPKGPGALTYQARLMPKPSADGKPVPALRDTIADNNQAVLSVLAKGRPRVLYIEGETAAKGYLTQALQRENIDVEARGPHGMPSSAKDLLPFDLVLLSDVSATLVSQAQMLAIESYVRDLGGGFVMVGGENSFGSGGYQGTQLEKLLPVRFEQEKKREQPSLGLVLCIDRSASMNGPKLELAKDAARATAEMLAPDDLIGVVAFDSQAIPLVRLQRAQNRIRISTDIAKLTAGGGTQLLPPLNEAYQQLVSANAKIKHVILLTDGQAEYQGIIELTDQMVQNKITVSTVGVGAGADQTLLTAIAEHGGGRFYFTQDASSVPKIFTKETTQVARSALIEERVVPRVSKFVELLDGVGIEGAPPLRGYVSTKAKPLAEVILISPLGEPLLARWRQGLGQAVAFTSDAKNRWAVDWLRWPGYAKFWAQLVRSSMRHDGQRTGHGYDLQTTVASPFLRVRVDAVSADDRFLSGLQTDLEVISPTGGGLGLIAGKGDVLLRKEMSLVAPGRYEAEVRLGRTGSFLLRAVHRSPSPHPGTPGPVVAESWGTLSLPYPREYLALPPDDALLAQIAALTHGQLLRDASSVVAPGDEKIRYLRSLWPSLVFAAIGMLLLDVLLRRLRLFGFRALSL